MRPSEVLDRNREAVRALIERYPVANPRIFGSVAEGTDREGSDLDLLVDTLPGTTLFHLGGLHSDLEALLGIQVDLVTTGDIHPDIRNEVLERGKAASSRRDDTLVLRRMRELAIGAIQFAEGMDADTFVADRRTHQAVAMNIFMIGELAARTRTKQPDLAALHPDLDWATLSSLWPRIFSAGFALDVQASWRVVVDELPSLVDRIDRALPG